MTSLTSRRPYLAGLTLLAAACLVAIPASGATAVPKTQDFAGTAGPSRPGTMMNLAQFRATPSQITLMHHFGCGEFTFIRGKVTNGRFSVSREFPNGYGVAFRGTVNLRAKTLTGQLKSWHGPIAAQVDDPATEGIDETVTAQPACDSGWQKIKVKPSKRIY